MTEFTFDENMDDKRLVIGCNAEGQCQTFRYPKCLRGVKDFIMLPELLSMGRTLVTNDANIVSDHIDSIPGENPGVIIVKLRRPSRTMTSKLAATLLKNFKLKFPSWPETNWSNILLEISELEVCVSWLPSRDGERFILNYDSPSFAEEFSNLIDEIRRGKSRIDQRLLT